MLRPTTPAEQQRFRGYFQHLNASRPMVTGETSIAYNSVAWALGITDRWLWPGNTLRDFDHFFALSGFRRAAFGNVALWGHNNSLVTHVSVEVPGVEGVWESKCGADLRIRHARRDLAGSTFGQIIAYYAPDQNKTVPAMVSNANTALLIAPAEIQLLKQEAAAFTRKKALEFGKAFEAWQNSWFAGRHAVCSNTLTRTSCAEYFRLLKMGGEFIPLLALKLTEKENFFAARLLEQLLKKQGAEDLEVDTSQQLLEGEQGRVVRWLQHYLQTRHNFALNAG